MDSILRVQRTGPLRQTDLWLFYPPETDRWLYLRCTQAEHKHKTYEATKSSSIINGNV